MMGEYIAPPNSANTSPSLGMLTSGVCARLRTYSLVGIPYLIMDFRACFFCCLRLQQNHIRTESIDTATTPLTVPAMIGVARFFDDGCGDGVGEGVAVAKFAAT